MKPWSETRPPARSEAGDVPEKPSFSHGMLLLGSAAAMYVAALTYGGFKLTDESEACRTARQSWRKLPNAEGSQCLSRTIDKCL